MSPNMFTIKPTCIYVYLRVSTYAQTYKSNGLEEQNVICQEYIKNNFPKFNGDIQYYSDVGSSYNNKNILTNLNKIVRKLLYQTNTLLLVRDISRLGRDTFQVFNLLKKIRQSESYIIGIDENLCYNYSRLMDRKFSHSIIDSEEHSDTKSNTSVKRINKIVSNGGYVGRVPYGCQIIKKNNIPYIYQNTNEINTIRMIKQVFLNNKCIIKTTKYLNTKNLKYRNNVNWNETQIKNCLKKYFPNLLKDNNSDIVDNYFLKYPKLNQESIDINEVSNIPIITNKLGNININNTNTKKK